MTPTANIIAIVATTMLTAAATKTSTKVTCRNYWVFEMILHPRNLHLLLIQFLGFDLGWEGMIKQNKINSGLV